MMNSGRLFPGSSLVIEDVLRGEPAEDAAALRPSLVQLRAAADRPVPVPSVQLQRLLDLNAEESGGAPTAVVTELGAFRAAREGKGLARYGAKRRVAATSLAVMVFLGAGTGVAAAVDGGVREGIVASVARVAPALVPVPAPVPAPVAAPVAVPAPVVAPEAPVVPVAAPAPVPAPAVEVARAPMAADVPDDAADAPDAVEGDGPDGQGHGKADGGAAAAGPGRGQGAAAAGAPGDAGDSQGNGRGNGNAAQGQGQGSAVKDAAWVPPGQAKKASGRETAAERQVAEMLKHLKR